MSCDGCEAITAETSGRLFKCDACCDAIDEAKRQRLMDMEVDEIQNEQEPGGLTPAEGSAIRHERTRV